MKYIVSLVAVFVFVFNADAAVKVKNNTANRYVEQTAAETGVAVEDIDETTAIATLENDIAILDEEIAKCEKQKKGWIAATVIGSAGVLSTGIAAGVQGVKIKEQKDTISDQTSQLKNLQKEGMELDKKIKSSN